LKPIKQAIDDNSTRLGRTFELTVQALIVVSLIDFSVETLPDLSPTALAWLSAVEFVVVVFFTVEYGLRILTAENKLKFIFSPFGLIDLLSILPFYLSLGIDLRYIRALRLFRLFRVLKLVRYRNAIRRFQIALMIAREELVLYLMVTMLLLYFAAVGIYYCENAAQPKQFASIFHSLWWAVVTLTTVGYGDVYPVTVGGRIFTFFVLLVGIGIISVPAGLISSAFSKAREIEAAHSRGHNHPHSNPSEEREVIPRAPRANSPLDE
jgi:voltage-gated potassium channel